MKKANARLIASAPELLMFAEKLSRTACQSQYVSTKCICFSCMAKELIAKATGGK